MEIRKQSNSPYFKAKLVAKAITPKSSYEILEIDKIKDAPALKKLADSFKRENVLERFPDNGLLSVTLEFMKNLFKSVNNPNTKTFMTLTDGTPSGIMTVESSIPEKYMHVEYLAAWKPDGMAKPHNNGKVLIRHLFEKAKQNNTETIDLTPGFKSDTFYEKMGFKKDGYDVCINHNEIRTHINNIDKSIKYEPLNNPTHIVLNI